MLFAQALRYFGSGVHSDDGVDSGDRESSSTIPASSINLLNIVCYENFKKSALTFEFKTLLK